MISINSGNFGFLKADSPQLVRLGALAEHYFQDDPNTCLIKLRQFGELPFRFPYLAPLKSEPGFIPRASAPRVVEIERCAAEPAAVPAGQPSSPQGLGEDPKGIAAGQELYFE